MDTHYTIYGYSLIYLRTLGLEIDTMVELIITYSCEIGTNVFTDFVFIRCERYEGTHVLSILVILGLEVIDGPYTVSFAKASFYRSEFLVFLENANLFRFKPFRAPFVLCELDDTISYIRTCIVYPLFGDKITRSEMVRIWFGVIYINMVIHMSRQQTI